MNSLTELLEQTLQRNVDPAAQVTSIKLLLGGNQGYSGGLLQYYEVEYKSEHGQLSTLPLVTKEAPLVERKVLAWLNTQRQPGLPYTYSFDLVTDKPLSRPSGAGQSLAAPTLDLQADTSMLVCQQYLDNLVGSSSPAIVKKAAEELAALHYANLGRQAQFQWLPLADHNYYENHIVGEVWRPFWIDSLKITRFNQKYGHLTSALETAATRFIDFTDMLWQEGSSLTLVHADMQDAHVLTHQNKPYFIDWGQARYGSFYIDLPNYFTPQTALQYRDALAKLGYEIPRNEFLERYQEAGRYVGFKYLSYCLWAWRELEPKYDDHWLDLVKVALGGGYGLARD